MPRTSRSRSVSTIVLTAGLLALTACTGPEPAPPPKSSPPVFENEEQALAAVTETYQRFQELSFQILAEGGANPERISTLASDDVAQVEIDGYRRSAELGYAVTGTPSVQSVVLDLWLPHPDSLQIVARADVCVDISSVQVLDSAGASVVPADRATQSLWSVDVAYREADRSLFVSSKQKEKDQCD